MKITAVYFYVNFNTMAFCDFNNKHNFHGHQLPPVMISDGFIITLFFVKLKINNESYFLFYLSFVFLKLLSHILIGHVT